jgi:hypothetical protein
MAAQQQHTAIDARARQHAAPQKMRVEALNSAQTDTGRCAIT